jgi:hypothetical protein
MKNVLNTSLFSSGRRERMTNRRQQSDSITFGFGDRVPDVPQHCCQFDGLVQLGIVFGLGQTSGADVARFFQRVQVIDERRPLIGRRHGLLTRNRHRTVRSVSHFLHLRQIPQQEAVMLQNETLLLVTHRLDLRRYHHRHRRRRQRYIFDARRPLRLILPGSPHAPRLVFGVFVFRRQLPHPLRLPTDHAPAHLAAALTLLSFGGIEQREIVIVGELLRTVYVSEGEQRHPELTVH